MVTTKDLTKNNTETTKTPILITKDSDLPLISAKTGTNWHELTI